jgi:hypothetical protein
MLMKVINNAVDLTSRRRRAGDVSGYRMKFGAENKTATVEIIVNNVNMIRHSRSTTIAANFQSFAISPFSSSLRSFGDE